MIVLDTNVLSELFKPAPHTGVMDWIASQPDGSLFTTSITRGEMFFGLHCMPDGHRKQTLLRGVNRLFEVRFSGQVLDYDSDAASIYSVVASGRRAAGQPISQSDAMIAGIVRAHGATLATRNVRDFEGCGVMLVDPWH